MSSSAGKGTTRSVRRFNSLTPSSSFHEQFDVPARSSSRDMMLMANSPGVTSSSGRDSSSPLSNGGVGGTGVSTPNSSRRLNSNSSLPTPATTSKQPRGKKGGGGNDQRNSNAFNPRLIFSQIVSLQCFHYVILGLLFQINFLFFGRSITIDRIFTDEYIKMWSTKGLPDTIAVLISSIAGYGTSCFIVCNICLKYI